MNKEQKQELEREKVLSLYGENKKLETNPDIKHSIKCTNGTFVPKTNGDIRVVKGIPFAMPPIGENRWRKPVPIPDGDDIYQAYYNGKSPIQTVIASERASYYPQSEDCLYLNIWVNDSCQNKNKLIIR